MQIYDVAVIGGGVVGCAVLHQLTSEGYQCILLEKEPDLVTGASAGNSGIYASGFDTSRDTLEGKCLAKATSLNERFFKIHNIPRGHPGAFIIASSKTQAKRLPDLLKEAHEAGHHGCQLLTQRRMRELEPNIGHEVRAGMWVPGERPFDPWLLPITLAHVAKKQGAEIFTNNEVITTRIQPNGVWQLQTRDQSFKAKVVINAGGLFGDYVESMNEPPSFRIKPRLGEYIIYDKSARDLINHILMPVPTSMGRGIIIFPTVYGNVIVGPTAVPVEQRQTGQVPQSTIQTLKNYAEKILPGLASHEIVGTYAGLRPATQYRDYQIKHNPQRNWITVCSIRATGASASLAIASHVNFLLKNGLKLEPTQGRKDMTRPVTWTVNEEGELCMDGDMYKITHPISRFGLNPIKVPSKL